MKTTNGESCRRRARAAGQAQLRGLLLALLGFGAGLALGAIGFHRPSAEPDRPALTPGLSDSGLSETTRSILQGLRSPVEVRFYSLLDRSAVPESTQAFARRVDQLLSVYETAAKGKLKISRITSSTYANNTAAAKDGIREFNGDKGNPCFLGIAVGQDGAKASLPWLAPDWEPGLECELSRAIATVADPSLPGQGAVPPPPTDSTALEAVKHSVTNLDSVSFEQGAQILREAALNEFAQATREMETRVKQAQEVLAQAKNGQSEAEQQAALQKLQQIQTEQTERLKEIAAKSQAQIQAFQQYKKAAQ